MSNSLKLSKAVQATLDLVAHGVDMTPYGRSRCRHCTILTFTVLTRNHTEAYDVDMTSY